MHISFGRDTLPRGRQGRFGPQVALRAASGRRKIISGTGFLVEGSSL